MASIAPPPTVEECCDLIFEHCQVLYDSPGTQDGTDCNVDIDLQSTAILIGALDVPAFVVQELKERMQALRQGVKSQHEIIRDVQDLCLECKKYIASTPTFIKSKFHDFRVEEPRILPVGRENVQDYAAVWPDQMDARAYWFRQYFVAKPYITIIGNTADSVIIISVVKEKLSSKDTSTRYRIIFRQSGALSTLRHLVSEKSAEETEAYLESQGQSHYLDSSNNLQLHLRDQQQQQQQQQRRRPLRSISSAIIPNTHHHSTIASSPHVDLAQNRIMRAAIYSTHPNLDFRELKELSAESTILAGLEKEILKFDEMEIPKFYKFGVLTVQDGQHTEEEWFSNSGLSPRFKRFMNILGKPVELEGYQGYKAGLDTKSGESGKTSYAASWLDFEIMFHVAPLMPYKDHDKQQVHRKRYIGNDIVCIVFMDGDEAKFDPEVIRSQFLHVYIVVHPEQVDGKEAWRIQVISKKNVSECNPLIPSPALFYDEKQLRSFLLLKMINAENAALKSSEKLAMPIAKARAGTLRALWETGVKFSGSSTSNSNRNELDDKRAERPKSAGAQRVSRGSMRSLCSALTDPPPRSMTPDIPPPPPVPVTSRSSMLREWKKLGRRRSSGCTSNGQQSPVPSESSTSSSSRGASPLLVVEEPPSIFDVQEKKSKDTIRQFTYLPRPVASHQISKLTGSTSSSESMPYGNNAGGGIRSRAQHLVTSVMGRRPGNSNRSNQSHQHQQLQQQQQQLQAVRSATTGSLIRSKTFMLDHAGRLIQGEK